MSSQSPQRIRKPQPLPVVQGTMQNMTVPREASPSPSGSFRERQRPLKTHSMPIVPSVSQVLSSANQHQQPSPTITNASRRTPPPTSRISPVTGKLTTGSHATTNGRELSPERLNSPPPTLTHSHSQPITPQLVSSGSQPPASVLAHHPRPLGRVHPPQFLSQYQTPDEKWHVTDELMADIERADQQGQLQGTSGVAYAGGAASGPVHMQHNAGPTRDSTMDRVRMNDRTSPKDSDNSNKRPREKDRDRDTQNSRESPKNRERSQTISTVVAPHVGQESSTMPDRSDFRSSPQYQAPMTSPGERSATYTQYVPENYSASMPPPTRKPVPIIPNDNNSTRLTPPGSIKATSQSPPSQGMAARPAGRSLPVQEEPEEDVGHETPNGKVDYREHRSPKHSPDHYAEPQSPRYDSHRPHRNGVHDDDDDDEAPHETLNGGTQQDKSGDDDDAAFTPRSPSTTLPERSRESPYGTSSVPYATPPSQYPHPAVENEQKTIRAAKHRSGRTDHIGMRSFDPALFEHTVNTLRSDTQSAPSQTQPTHSQTTPHSEIQQSHFPANGQYADQPSRPGTYASPPPTSQLSSHFESTFDDVTSSYLHSFFQSNRPKAPIPPTPQSNTAAPSPSPAISAIQGDLGIRQVGSPYPYPFTHIRRNALPTAQNAPSTNYDQNNPALVREQLALQMQIYALNNGLAAPSESAFSPSSTPFPGPGYNPWGFMYHPPREGDSNMSMRSSPSHEPVPLPAPPVRGHGLRRRGNSSDLRIQSTGGRNRVKPPPRVESTQPRETSPEPSSGEETAGEEGFVDQWVDGDEEVQPEETGEWVDETEEDEEDLLQLEYHPTYVTRADKRKRRWETRWDALVQAFQALDRETDTTLVLLAAPTHTSKMYSATSRSVRRDAALSKSNAMTNLRTSFNRLASQRKTLRARRFTLADHLSPTLSRASVDGSQVSGETREEDLRRALETALGSLGALGTLYEQREARWRDEMRRLSEDREHVELLLRQALGPALVDQHERRPTV